MNVNPFSYLIEKLKSKVDTAGTGLTKSGTTISTYVPRITRSANTKIGQNSFDVNEYSASSDDLPDSNFYHILTAEGPDDAYLTQIALGMTLNKMFYRRCNANTWEPWEELVFKSDIDIKGQSVTFSPYISDAGYIKTWKMGKMYFISFNAPINPCSADTVLISGYPNTIQRFYGLLGADNGTNIRIELKNGELVTNTAVTTWLWYAGNIFFYES